MEPFLRDGRFVGRGVADDKGQLVMHSAAIEALRAARQAPASTSRSCSRARRSSAPRACSPGSTRTATASPPTLAIISDTAYFEGNLPAITVGLRGIMYAQIDVELSPVDLHSGLYGGTVENPANALPRSSPPSRVPTAGSGSRASTTPSSRSPTTSGRRWPRLPFDDEAYRAEIPVTELVGEAGYSTLERKGSRPTLDVNGIWGGFQGEGAKTIIPAHAHAKLSCRLVADQDPATVFARSATTSRRSPRPA